MKRILIVEDDPAILKGLEAALQEENYEVIKATDGERCHQIVKHEKLDLIVLDVMLPKKHGFEVCRDLKKEGFATPILIITSKREEMDQVLGREFGADDFIIKPFSIKELHSRIKTLLRRKEESGKEITEYRFGEIHIDFKKREALRNNKTIKLTAKEFEMLQYFIRHEGEIVTYEMLLEDVWGHDNYSTELTVDNYILSIRKKIEDEPNNPKYIITVNTTGYRFVK